MAKLSAEEYIEIVRRSKLVDNADLEKAVSGLNGDREAAGVAAKLIEARLITSWQNDKLMQGKHQGFILGKYKLLSHISSGGMSSVYLAEHVLMQRRVAIKVLPPARLDDSSFLERFHLECRVMAALDHPNIVRAHDFDVDGKLHYLVMEYVEGPDLDNVVKKEGPLAFARAAEYIRQACDGLGHAHEAGMIHRDMKPANLLVDQRGTIKVLDLGVARITGANDSTSLTLAHNEDVVGTADFLAPEQALDSHNVDYRADIYALGSTFYYILTGHPPFPNLSMAQKLIAHQTQEPSPIEKDRPDIPRGLLLIIRRMMAKKLKERFSTMAEVNAELTTWLGDPDYVPDYKNAKSAGAPAMAAVGQSAGHEGSGNGSGSNSQGDGGYGLIDLEDDEEPPKPRSLFLEAETKEKPVAKGEPKKDKSSAFGKSPLRDSPHDKESSKDKDLKKDPSKEKDVPTVKAPPKEPPKPVPQPVAASAAASGEAFWEGVLGTIDASSTAGASTAPPASAAKSAAEAASRGFADKSPEKSKFADKSPEKSKFADKSSDKGKAGDKGRSPDKEASERSKPIERPSASEKSAASKPIERPSASEKSASEKSKPIERPSASEKNNKPNDKEKEGDKGRALDICPACGSALPKSGVVCARCGFNVKTGARAESKASSMPSDAPVKTRTSKGGAANEPAWAKKLKESKAVPGVAVMLVLGLMVWYIYGPEPEPEEPPMDAETAAAYAAADAAAKAAAKTVAVTPPVNPNPTPVYVQPNPGQVDPITPVQPLENPDPGAPSGRPADVTIWDEEDFDSATRDSAPELFEAVTYIAEKMKGSDRLDKLLVKILEPGKLVDSTSPEAPPPTTDERVLHLAVTTLAASKSPTAKKAIDSLTTGRLQVSNPDQAMVALLIAIAKNPSPERDKILLRALLSPEELRPPGTTGMSAKALQERAREVVTQYGGFAIRVELGRRLNDPSLPAHLIQFLQPIVSAPHPFNVPAQVGLFLSDQIEPDEAALLQDYFMKYSEQSLNMWIFGQAVAPAAAVGAVGPAPVIGPAIGPVVGPAFGPGGGENFPMPVPVGPRPEVGNAAIAAMTVEQAGVVSKALWEDRFAEAIWSRFSVLELNKVQEQLALMQLSSNLPTPFARARMQRLVRATSASIEPAKFSDGMRFGENWGDPGLWLVIKDLERDPFQPRPGARVEKKNQWFDASWQYLTVLNERFYRASLIRGEVAADIDRRPFKLHPGANVIAEYRLEWPADLDGKVPNAPPLVVHYARVKEKASLDNRDRAHYYDATKPTKRRYIMDPADPRIETHRWLDGGARPRQGADGMEMSLDVVLTRINKKIPVKGQTPEDLFIEVLSIEIPK